MKKIILIVFFILLLAIFYICTSTWGLYKIATLVTVPHLKIYRPILIIILVFGLVTLVSAVGIILRKDFFRKFWIYFSVFLFLFHLSWFVYDLMTKDFDLTNLIEPVATFLLALFSWRLLRSERTILLFKQNIE